MEYWIKFYEALRKYEKEYPKVSMYGDENSQLLQTGGK